jgi:hypothetical protein
VKREAGKETILGQPISFTISLDPLANAAEFAELNAFQHDLLKLSRAMSMTIAGLGDAEERLAAINRAIDVTPSLETEWRPKVLQLIQECKEIRRRISGDEVMRGRNENSLVSIQERLAEAASAVGYTLSKPTETARQSYRLAAEEHSEVLKRIREIRAKDLQAIEAALDAAGAPGTPGRLPAAIK